MFPFLSVRLIILLGSEGHGYLDAGCLCVCASARRWSVYAILSYLLKPHLYFYFYPHFC